MAKRRTPLTLLLSLRGRLLFLICLATLPAILFTFVVAENERVAALARTESDALHLAGLVSREHAQQIEGARELLTWLGAKLAREGPESPIVSDPDFLSALLAGHPQLINIGVLSPDGRVLTSAYPLSVRRSWVDNPAFVAAHGAEGVATGTYVISPIFGRPTLNHAYAVRDAAKKATAILFSGLDLDRLSAVARRGAASGETFIVITDRDGRVLARGAGGGSMALGEAPMEVPDVVGLARSRRGRVLTIAGADSPRYYVATPLMEDPHVFAVVGLPHEQVLRRANAAFYRTLGGLSVLTLFTIAAVFVAAELGVLRALRSLARTAKRFGAGDLSARATVPRGHDELASLAGAFNGMAASLARRHRETLEAQERLKALATRVQMARETEAARISRELHDEIGQVLTSLKIDVSRLHRHCEPTGERGDCAFVLREDLATLGERVAEALDFVRRISLELRPGVLDKLGLVAALEWQAREIEARTDLIVQVEAEDVGSELDELREVTLFRIAQEALTNVVRHAKARVVEIHLGRSAEGIALEVRDDGVGISAADATNEASIGIVGMRERAMLIDARLTLEGEPGRGTVLRAILPPPKAPETGHANPVG